jgi:hypothetical protein
MSSQPGCSNVYMYTPGRYDTQKANMQNRRSHTQTTPPTCVADRTPGCTTYTCTPRVVLHLQRAARLEVVAPSICRNAARGRVSGLPIRFDCCCRWSAGGLLTVRYWAGRRGHRERVRSLW